jgi:hypothetical protein
MGQHHHNPCNCRPGDTTDKVNVQDWPLMSDRSAVAFKRFTGVKIDYGKLVRKGNLIFEVGLADRALCHYNHSRQF